MELLAIDVAAELERLGDDRLQGPWARPAEIVRLAVAAGARRIEVELERHRFTVTAAGAELPREALDGLAELLDRGSGDDRRHRRIVELERTGFDLLLTLVGAESLHLRAVSAGAATTVEARSGRVRRERREVAAEAGFRLTVAGALEAEAARRWLETVAAFAPVPVEVDRRRLDPGFARALIQQTVSSPLTATIALTVGRQRPLLHLLRHGVVAARATVPGYPPFEAAVELAGEVEGDVPPHELRVALTPHLGELIERVVDMTLRVAEDLPSLAPWVRRPVVTWLLEAAARGLRREEILGRPLLASLGPEGRAWLTPGEVLRAAAEGPVAVVAETDRHRHGRVDHCLVLSDEEIDRLTELGVANLWHPPPPPRWSGLGDRLRGWRQRLAARLRRATVVAEAELSPSERHLLELLTARAGHDHRGARLHWSLVEADTPALRPGPGDELRLARRHPLVERARVLVNEVGGEWLYPSVLAMGAAPFADLGDLRRTWLTVHTTRPEGGWTTPHRSTMDDLERIRSVYGDRSERGR